MTKNTDMTRGQGQSGTARQPDAAPSLPATITSRPWVAHGHNRLWVSKYGGVSERPKAQDPLTKDWVVHEHSEPPVNTNDWQVVDPPSVDITYKSVLLECKASSKPTSKTHNSSS